jgi:hypothetical protein
MKEEGNTSARRSDRPDEQRDGKNRDQRAERPRQSWERTGSARQNATPSQRQSRSGRWLADAPSRGSRQGARLAGSAKPADPYT